MSSRYQPHPLAVALKAALLCLSVASANPVFADSAQHNAQDYHISAGSLASTLSQFAGHAGVALSFDAAQLKGQQSAGLQGPFSVEGGFSRLLEGTQLKAVRLENGSYVLQSQQPSGPMELDAMTIMDNHLGATTEGTDSYTTGITNTATKMNLSIKETPQTITVITRQRMDDQHLSNISQVLKQVPGVTMSQDGGERFNIYARGSALNSYQFDGVTTYQENQTRTMPSTLLDMAIYDHVEVVRGATGLTTGAGDPSGVVNVVRKRPTKEFKGYVQGEVGSWEHRRLEADISGPLTENGKLRGRLVAAKQKNHSFMDWYKQDRDLAYGVLETDITDNTVARVSIEHQRYRPTGAQGVPIIYNNGQPTDFSRSTGSGAHWDSDKIITNNYNVGLEHLFANDWQFKVAATYMDVDRDTMTGSYSSPSNNSNISPDGTASIAQSASTATQRQKAIDATLQGPFELFGQSHELIFGANYLNYINHHHAISGKPILVDFNNWNNSLPKPDKGTFDPALDYNVETHQSGYFAATRLNLTDSAHLILGARSSDYYYNYYLRVLPNGNPMEYKMKEHGVVTPYAGFVYDLTPDQSVYVSYTDIFKPQSNRDRDGKMLAPVIGKNYELGWKGDFYDGRLNASAAVYLIKRDNVAELDPDFKVPGTDDTASRAVSGAKTKGLDLEIAGELSPGWNLQAGYSHSHTEDAKGNRLTAQLPMDTFRFWSTYQLPGQWQRLTVGGGVDWNSSNSLYFNRYKARVTQDDYSVVSMMARYKFTEKLSSTLNLNNVLDKKYYAGFSGSYAHYGAPRNVMLNLRYEL